ncbi:MAG: hypothetical protein K0S37_2069 [Microbacterium sp.]|nr:hypothetical protein [Microbacterium sp.]
MQHVDGNAIAGDLVEVFGADLTAAVASCMACGTRGALAELRVYRTAMGSVARCPHCDTVLIVVTAGAGHPMVSMSGLRALDSVSETVSTVSGWISASRPTA